MKTTILLFAGVLILFACKKDPQPQVEIAKAFEDITYADIKNSEGKFTTHDLVLNSETESLKIGAIVFYKTQEGHYGKFKMLNFDPTINQSVNIEIVNYLEDGSLSADSKPDFELKFTSNYDLDTITESMDDTVFDFTWLVDKTFVTLIPQNTTRFYIYSNK